MQSVGLGLYMMCIIPNAAIINGTKPMLRSTIEVMVSDGLVGLDSCAIIRMPPINLTVYY